MTFSQIYNDPFAFTRVGTCVLLFNKQGEVLLGKRLSSHGSGTYSVPGGHLDKWESLHECAKREVEEETGIKLAYPMKTFYASDESYADLGKHYVTVFLMTKVDDTQVPVLLEPEKCESWDFYPLQKLPTPLFPAMENLVRAISPVELDVLRIQYEIELIRKGDK